MLIVLGVKGDSAVSAYQKLHAILRIQEAKSLVMNLDRGLEDLNVGTSNTPKCGMPIFQL